MSVPRATTIAAVETELPALEAYAGRHGWRARWAADDLVLALERSQPESKDTFRLKAALGGYRAVPPAWTFERASDGAAMFPQAGTVPGGVDSMFHSSNVICAPFNRLAYKDHGGPHSDWGGPSRWLEVGGKVQAFTLADMFAIILGHLRHSPGVRP